jgi:hypothetical protein
MLFRLGIAGISTVVALVLLLPASAATGGTARATVDCPGARADVSTLTLEQIRSTLICVVNNERTIRGLPAYVVDARLQAAAQKYADGSSTNPYAGERISAEGYNWTSYAWLGAGNARTVFQVVQLHMGIEAECREVLAPYHLDIGVGYGLDVNREPDWQQVFAVETDPTGDNTGPGLACPEALLGNYGSAQPPLITSTAPRTTITRARVAKFAGSGRKARAKFFFRSSQPDSSFKCRMDSRPFRWCGSPSTYWVNPGRPTFRVRAVNESGKRDRTPAVLVFRVLRRR